MLYTNRIGRMALVLLIVLLISMSLVAHALRAIARWLLINIPDNSNAIVLGFMPNRALSRRSTLVMAPDTLVENFKRNSTLNPVPHSAQLA